MPQFHASAQPTARTIGMHLDDLVSRIDSLPPTYTYAAVVVTSLAFAILLLNSGGGAATPPMIDNSKSTDKSRDRIRRTDDNHRTNRNALPQPKWHILKLTNVLVGCAFLVSVLAFASDAQAYLNDSPALLRFLALWSTFLCYFFGFFGISFVEIDDFVNEAEEIEQDEQQQQQQKQEDGKVVAKQAVKGAEPPVKVVQLHPPASSTPVCGVDSPPSCQPASSQPSTSKPSIPSNLKELSNEEIASLVLRDVVKDYQLEKLLDPRRAVDVRRLKFDAVLGSLGHGGALHDLPHRHDLDYARVLGANCEIVVGYVPIPVGMAGPITLNGESVYIPMATTEGCLVASTNRGCKAITQGSGATSVIVRDGITRAPLVRMPSAAQAAEMMLWIEVKENFQVLKRAFESTTSFGKLLEARPTIAGRNVYIRLKCFAGDAMGMNMISKGSLAVIEQLKEHFPQLTLTALSGNLCTDKKAAAINWIEGRGKSVVIEATIPQTVVRATLKTTVGAIVEANVNKNLIGSALAGVVGGFNAHAANNVTAVFLATGQDPAQNVESSNCMTLMEETPEGDLWISCTMPSIEVGTVGGGTGLPAQAACLKAVGAYGGRRDDPGRNARRLAHVVAAATMAGELSLMAALASNSLVAAHMAHNRKPAAAASTSK